MSEYSLYLTKVLKYILKRFPFFIFATYVLNKLPFFRYLSMIFFTCEKSGLVGIESLQIIEGDLPSRAEKMVIEWATLYQKELLNMWNNQEFSKLPPLK